MISTSGAIATPHHLATRAGRDAYAQGGNALDAALAAAAVLSVVYPHNTGIGGDLVAVVQSPDGRMHGLNATGWSAASGSIERMVARHGAEIPRRGASAVTVPGAVRGWAALAGLGARLDPAAWLDTAIGAARDGVTVPASLALCLAGEWPTLEDPGFRAVFASDDRPLRRGERLRQPALAATLEGLAAHGLSSFYEGETGRSLVGRLAALGADFVADDFRDYQAEATAPLQAEWDGGRIHTLGPNTQGFALVRAAVQLQAGERDADPRTIARLFAEGNMLRDTRLGDPRRVNIDVDELINGAVALPEPGLVPDPRLARGDTIGIAAADADGWSVSLVQSLFHLFGSGVYDADTGVLFHNRGYSFALDADAVGRYSARTRPPHTLMPVIVTDGDGRMRFVQATMGGKAQAQIHTHLLLNLTRGASAAETVSAPRWTLGAYQPGDRSDSVYAEANVPDDVIDALHEEGYPIVTVPPLTEMLGHSNVIRRTSDGFDAAADPRSDGASYVA